MTATELFDTHCHLFERGYHGRYGFLTRAVGDELASYERFRDEFAITRSLVIGYEEADRYQGNNEYIEGLAQRREWIVPVRFVAPGHPIVSDSVAFYARDAASTDAAVVALDAARVAGVAPSIVSFNATPESLHALAPVVRRMPGTWFLISHLGLPGPVAAADARERLAPITDLAGLDNVSIKVSGQYAASAGGYPHHDAQIIVDVIADALGIPALVWGSDFSPCLEYISFDEAIECLMPTGASAQDRADIVSGNATRMFTNRNGVRP